MKKKKAIVSLLILLVLAGVYVYRACREARPDGAQQALPQATAIPAADAPDSGSAADTLTLLEDSGGAESGDNAAEAGDEPTALPDSDETAQAGDADVTDAPAIEEDGAYTSRDDVALYIHTYGRLPDNFMTKKEAQALGWEGGGLDKYAFGMCIGGSHYGNYEGLLPEKKGRNYTECDIDTLHRSSRGAKRIVFSNDGLIYYTDDHYDSFTLLYGEE